MLGRWVGFKKSCPSSPETKRAPAGAPSLPRSGEFHRGEAAARPQLLRPRRSTSLECNVIPGGGGLRSASRSPAVPPAPPKRVRLPLPPLRSALRGAPTALPTRPPPAPPSAPAPPRAPSGPAAPPRGRSAPGPGPLWVWGTRPPPPALPAGEASRHGTAAALPDRSSSGRKSRAEV